jgi:serine/threonine protein kinase
MNLDCPTDDELLVLVCDEPGYAGVREHVEHCSTCRTRLNLLNQEVPGMQSLRNFADPFLSTTIIPNVPNAARTSPKTIGRYIVVGDLGSGGQADVYRVIDAELGRYLVLKLSRRPAGSAEVQRDTLIAEGRLLAELDHPGLVRILDIGIHDGRAYLVLEHVSGRNLKQYYEDRRPTPRDAALLIAEVCRVVSYAHRNGVVHGDITPHNILIDGAGRARLIDFGLARIENAWGEGAGISGGTPEFLPPEMSPLGGGPERAAPSSDVFGLGATLYWLLTGSAPFFAPTGVQALERSQRCDIDVEALQRARVPSRILRICLQSLAADPTKRPTPDAMADELERASRHSFTSRIIAAIGMVALMCVGLVFWRAGFGENESTEDQSVVQSAPAIEVFSRDGVLNLSNKLPLRSGDRVVFWCDVSQGHQATMVWFNAAGEVKTFSPVHEVFEKVDRLFYPTQHRPMTLEQPEGSDLIFFCRDGQITDDELQACFPVGTPPPLLPERNWLTLRRHEVSTEGALPDVPREILEVEEMLKEIDRKLQHHFKGVTAIAFPHYPAEKVE